MLGISFSFAANLHNMRILWKFRKTKQEKQNQVYVSTQRSCKKKNEDKETNNCREIEAYLKRNNHISLREDSKKVLKQVCEVQNSTANCSPTWGICCTPCREVTIKKTKSVKSCEIWNHENTWKITDRNIQWYNHFGALIHCFFFIELNIPLTQEWRKVHATLVGAIPFLTIANGKQPNTH